VVDVRGFPSGRSRPPTWARCVSTYDHDDEKEWDHVDFVVDAQLSPGNSGSPVLGRLLPHRRVRAGRRVPRGLRRQHAAQRGGRHRPGARHDDHPQEESAARADRGLRPGPQGADPAGLRPRGRHRPLLPLRRGGGGRPGPDRRCADLRGDVAGFRSGARRRWSWRTSPRAAGRIRRAGPESGWAAGSGSRPTRRAAWTPTDRRWSSACWTVCGRTPSSPWSCGRRRDRPRGTASTTSTWASSSGSSGGRRGPDRPGQQHGELVERLSPKVGETTVSLAEAYVPLAPPTPGRTWPRGPE
jgi:hypothetical protein